MAWAQFGRKTDIRHSHESASVKVKIAGHLYSASSELLHFWTTSERYPPSQTVYTWSIIIHWVSATSSKQWFQIRPCVFSVLEIFFASTFHLLTRMPVFKTSHSRYQSQPPTRHTSYKHPLVGLTRHDLTSQAPQKLSRRLLLITRCYTPGRSHQAVQVGTRSPSPLDTEVKTQHSHCPRLIHCLLHAYCTVLPVANTIIDIPLC